MHQFSNHDRTTIIIIQNLADSGLIMISIPYFLGKCVCPGLYLFLSSLLSKLKDISDVLNFHRKLDDNNYDFCALFHVLP
jgi:hypothetical protein